MSGTQDQSIETEDQQSSDQPVEKPTTLEDHFKMITESMEAMSKKIEMLYNLTYGLVRGNYSTNYSTKVDVTKNHQN